MYLVLLAEFGGKGECLLTAANSKERGASRRKKKAESRIVQN
jgi:hypothetical protein